MDTIKQKLMFEIMALGIFINENTEYCVFINFSGHVDNFDINICKSKKDYLTNIASTSVKTKFLEYYHKDESDVLACMKAKRDVLKEILETHDIPTDTMEEMLEVSVGYTF